MKKRIIAEIIRFTTLLAIVIVLSIVIVETAKAEESTAEQAKIEKQKKLEAEIEALVSTPLSNEEILGKDFIEYVNNKHKGGK